MRLSLQRLWRSNKLVIDMISPGRDQTKQKLASVVVLFVLCLGV